MDANLAEFEIACVANLMPENVEEARFLVPSLEVRPPASLPHLLDASAAFDDRVRGAQDERFAGSDEALQTALSNVALYRES